MLSELNEIVHVKPLLTVFLIFSVLGNGYGFIYFFPKCSFFLPHSFFISASLDYFTFLLFLTHLISPIFMCKIC